MHSQPPHLLITPDPRQRCTVLAVDDEPAILAILVHQLGGEFDLRTASTAAEAMRSLDRHPADIVVTDLTLPDSTGIQLLDWVYRHSPRTARVLISGTARLQDAADAINCGHIHRLILKPWRGEDLLAHLVEVARGVLLERSHERLLEKLRTVNVELERRVKERTEELEATNRTLERMALTDTLTGVSNRRAVELIAHQELQRRTRNPMALAFGLLDADKFKLVNSRHLLSGGDFALTHLARVLQATLRGSDSVGRVGGEEFMVVAPDTDATGAAVLAERLRAEVEGLDLVFHGQRISLTVSGGFAVAEAGCPATFDELRELAAEAMEEAKTGGRNRCVVKVYAPHRTEAGVPAGA